MSILTAWHAGRVRRWHTNPHLSWTSDYNDGHQGRVATLILLLHPAPTLEIISAALIHDGGEWAVGDVSGTVKARYPDLAVWLAKIEQEAIEAIFGAFPDLSPVEAQWLKFADRLDAWIWARHHRAPMDRDGWPAATCFLYAEACALGVDAEWTDLVRGMPV
jgi:hypothetical protein